MTFDTGIDCDTAALWVGPPLESLNRGHSHCFYMYMYMKDHFWFEGDVKVLSDCLLYGAHEIVIMSLLHNASTTVSARKNQNQGLILNHHKSSLKRISAWSVVTCHPYR